MPKKIANPIKVPETSNVIPEEYEDAPSVDIEAPEPLVIFAITNVEEGREAVAKGIIDIDSFEDRFHVPY